MVQPLEQLSPRRRRTRAQRTRRYLAAASRIVFAHGLDALTMQRVAKELDCAVGTIYRYFPSKDALVAALQREAIETLLTSYHSARPGWDAHIAVVGLDDRDGALVRSVAFGEFYIEAASAFPEEFHLLRQLMSDPRQLVSGADAQDVLPSAMALLDVGRRRLADATRSAAIEAGDDMQRAVIWWVSLTGALGIDKLGRFDATIFDGSRLASAANLDLFRGWGADSRMLENASESVGELRALGPLAHPVPHDIDRLIT